MAVVVVVDVAAAYLSFQLMKKEDVSTGFLLSFDDRL
jgi:hypothetical protein